jgi:hypothetical protein
MARLSPKYIRSPDGLTAMRFGTRQHALCVGMVTACPMSGEAANCCPKPRGERCDRDETLDFDDSVDGTAAMPDFSSTFRAN